MARTFRWVIPGLLWLILMLGFNGCSQAEPPAPTSTEAVVAQLPTPELATATPSPIPPTKTPLPLPTATATSAPTAIPTATATSTPTIEEKITAATIRIQVEGSPYLEEYITAGSGVIIDPGGLALTNYHLVEGAGFLQVTLSDGAIAPAQVIGRSACDDVALLQLTGSAFPALPLNGEETGDPAVAGYPLDADIVEVIDVVAGQPVTRTMGFLDAVTGTLRLDNSLDRGFSGGPLVSAEGSVAGLLSVGQPAESAPAYIIPASTLATLLPLLAEAGDQHWLGMNVGPLPTGGADSENAPVSATDGLLVYAIDLRGPADALGIRAGDVLLSLAGEELTGAEGMQTFCRVARAHQPGDPLPVVVERNQARYLGELNGAQLEQEVVALPPTATPAPVVTAPPPAATEPPAEDAGGLLEAMMDVQGEMQGLGGFLDGLMAGGCLNNAIARAPIYIAGVPYHVSCIHQPSDCQRILSTHGRIVNAPRFGPDSVAGAEVSANNIYESAINLFASGTTDLVAACASLIQNPDSSISNLIVATARQRIGQAVDTLNPAIANLQN